MRTARRIASLAFLALIASVAWVGFASPANAATQTITLTSCYSDIAGRTFEVAQGDTLLIQFSTPCVWAYGANFVGFSRSNGGAGENEVAVYDAWNVKVADVTRPGNPNNQATILITPNPGLKTTLTSTSESYVMTLSPLGYQRFYVKVTAAPDPPADPDWQPVGGGTNNDVRALVAGPGDTIYAGGYFSQSGTTSTNRVAQWDGTQWRALGTGVDGTVDALAVDGNGVLYAGGQIYTAGGVSVSNVARWDGTQWRAMGSGISDEVTALAVDESGRVYAGVGGFMSFSAGVQVWNGTSWSNVGSSFNGGPLALLAVNGRVYAGGSFTQAGGVTAPRVAEWNGSTWSSLGSGVSSTVRALAADRTGAIYAAGDFTTAGGQPANRIARWDGTTWSPLGSGVDGSVHALASDDEGNIYASGDFTTAGGQTANRVARWDGTAWSAVGTGMNSTVSELAISESGDLYAGGTFISAGGDVAYRVATYPIPDPPAQPTDQTAPAVPVAAPQAFVVPDGTDAALCGDLAPDSVDWPAIAHLRHEGWSVVYATWPNDNAGGWVCERQPVWLNETWSFAE